MLKLIIYLGALLIILTSGNNIASKSIKNTVNDSNIKNQVILIDNALMSYYRYHSYFPDELTSSEIQNQLGINNLNLNNISYARKAKNEFILQAKLNNNINYESPNSNVTIDL